MDFLKKISFLFGLGLILVALPLLAASLEEEPGVIIHIDGSRLSLVWGIPFIGILTSIALGPLLFPHFWEHHFGKIATLWSLTFIMPYIVLNGIESTSYQLLHTAILEYIPFVILLFSLFTVAGGVRLRGTLIGTPKVNTLFLLVGTVAASWMGTTGASMLLVRPLIAALQGRYYKAHVVIFFIFLVSNIGGALTPLGDPPLFLGFLKGVDFFWPLFHVLMPMALTAGVLLILFFIVDIYLYGRESTKKREGRNQPELNKPLQLEGTVNIILLGGIVSAVLMSGMWRPNIVWNFYHVQVELQNVVRDVLLLSTAVLSLVLTNPASRLANGFTWQPILEVAKLFAGIFVTIIPVIAILRAGNNGALAMITSAVTDISGHPVNAAYFWFTGILSSFLDNAPTYLVFFNTAGGDASTLMTDMSVTLAAISTGAVFMGANSYIGNAPNFMVRSIAEEQGIKMPSFFGYMLWSVGILIPLFILVTLLFF